HLGQSDDLAVDPMGARQPRLEAQAGLEDLWMMRLHGHRLRDGAVPGLDLLVDDADFVWDLALGNAWDARHHVLLGALTSRSRPHQSLYVPPGGGRKIHSPPRRPSNQNLPNGSF